MEEILNLDYNYRILIVKAINQSHNCEEASKKLGLSHRNLYNWMAKLNIKKNKDYGKVIQGARVTEKVR